MAIENTSDLRWRYQISRKDPCVIERKVNKPYSRFCYYKTCDSPNDAKRALLAIERDDAEQEQP